MLSALHSSKSICLGSAVRQSDASTSQSLKKPSLVTGPLSRPSVTRRNASVILNASKKVNATASPQTSKGGQPVKSTSGSSKISSEEAKALYRGM
jgi:hypothetical protein